MSVPTSDAIAALTCNTLESKNYIFRIECLEQRRTTLLVFFIDENLAVYMLQFGDIVSASQGGMRRE